LRVQVRFLEAGDDVTSAGNGVPVFHLQVVEMSSLDEKLLLELLKK
jgi:hypothetical protein